jgi:acetyl-CoA carboxylase biotin carboxyl carrier protein
MRGRLDVKEIKEILRILEEQDVTEFELEQDGTKLRICRGQRATSAGHLVAPTSFVAPVAAASPAPVAPPPVPVVAEGKEAVVNSPIVGTFYRSADPNSPPFVNVGDRVRLGQVLCIIEAMKLMNEIEAEVAGEVLKVHPENGTPVQYGDPLFTIRPS